MRLLAPGASFSPRVRVELHDAIGNVVAGASIGSGIVRCARLALSPIQRWLAERLTIVAFRLTVRICRWEQVVTAKLPTLEVLEGTSLIGNPVAVSTRGIRSWFTFRAQSLMH